MKTAMILAAGRGERLRPYTDTIPKALCRVGGIPLIERHVIALTQAGIDRIVINHAWLGGQIRRQLGNGSRFGVEIQYSPEPPGGLETGGGIFRARHLLGEAPFITVNADILTDYPYQTLTLPSFADAHLVLVAKTQGSTGDFNLDNTRIIASNSLPFTFAGIAIYRPAFFASAHEGRYSVTPMLRALLPTGRLSGELFNGLWMDTGTADQLLKAKGLMVC